MRQFFSRDEIPSIKPLLGLCSCIVYALKLVDILGKSFKLYILYNISHLLWILLRSRLLFKALFGMLGP
jgi:hypothetical protein